MPTATEIQERGGQAASRLYALAIQSMQQVGGAASRTGGYVHRKFNAFNETCRGLKNETSAQNWSSSTSERHNHDSSKNEMKTVLESACEETQERKELCALFIARAAPHAFQHFTWRVRSWMYLRVELTTNGKVFHAKPIIKHT
jgi:hypothetical protein